MYIGTDVDRVNPMDEATSLMNGLPQHLSSVIFFTPVAGSIFGPISQTHFSKSEFKHEMSSSALLDIQMTLLCVCVVDSFIPKLEQLEQNPTSPRAHWSGPES